MVPVQTQASTCKYAEVCMYHVPATQTVTSPGPQMLLRIEHFSIHLPIPMEYFFT